MELGAWLRSLGLERYEAEFRGRTHSCALFGACRYARERTVAMIEDAQERERSSDRAVTLCLALCLAILLYGSVAWAQSVAFINPGKSDEIYWMTATEGMQAAAHSLNVRGIHSAARGPLYRAIQRRL
jgi:hypothetical protein